jgi:hypothetical protein
LKEFDSIRKITFKKNRLRLGESTLAINSLKSLEVLDCFSNLVLFELSSRSNLGPFESLSNLRHLSLSNCGLDNHQLNERSFRGLVHLESLNLAKNNFTKPKANVFRHIGALLELDLSGNKVELEPFTFAYLQKLRKLSIELASMRHVIAFESLGELKELKLNTVNCTNMNADLFRHLRGVERLEWLLFEAPRVSSYELAHMRHLNSLCVNEYAKKSATYINRRLNMFRMSLNSTGIDFSASKGSCT